MVNVYDVKRVLYLLSALLFVCVISFAQEIEKAPGVVSQLTLGEDGRIHCTLHAHDDVAKEHHLSSENARFENAKWSTKKDGNSNATINITVFDFTLEGYPQAEEASAAFASAVDIWESSIQSDVPINVALVFQELGPNTLGSAGTTLIYRDFVGAERETWYGNALADKLSGSDLSPGQFDIIARFNTLFPNWYFGTDANTPVGDFDFRTVVLHELCHGLGYFGSMGVDNETNIGNWGFGIPDENGVFYPSIYDRLMLDRNGKQLIKENKFENFSTELGEALLTGPILARGPRINGATKGKGLKTFTTLDSEIFGDIPGLTDTWLPGSSYSHQDFVTYTRTPEGLMVPFLSSGFAVTDPGPLVLALFDDLGWNGKVNRQVEDPSARMALSGNDEYASSPVIFPNEVQKNFLLDLGEKSGEIITARMVDILGRTYKISYKERSPRYIDFDLSDSRASSGIYFLQLEFKNRKSEVIRVSKIQ